MSNIVKKFEFSKLAGCSPAAVTKGLHGPLKAALVGKRIDADHPAAVEFIEHYAQDKPAPPATGLDPLYEQAVSVCQMAGTYTPSFLRSALGIGWDRGVKILEQMQGARLVPKEAPEIPERRVVATRATRMKPPEKEDLIEIPEDIQIFNEMTLRELVDKFGTSSRFLDWLKATKEIENINEKRLKNAEKEGTVVSRVLVKHAIIEPIETAHIKLMTDGAETITNRAIAMIGAGRDKEAVKAFVVDQIASFIKPVKTRVSRIIKDMDA